GDRAQALDAVRTLVARQPDAVSAQTAAGDVLLAAGALDEAAAAYAQARDLSPRSSAALVGLARVALARGRPGEARALLEPLTEEGGSSVLSALADAAAVEGDHERAAALRARLADSRAALREGWRARVAALLGETDAHTATESPAATAEDGAEAVPAELLAAEEPASPALLRALREYFGFDAFRPGSRLPGRAGRTRHAGGDADRGGQEPLLPASGHAARRRHARRLAARRLDEGPARRLAGAGLRARHAAQLDARRGRAGAPHRRAGRGTVPPSVRGAR